MDVSLLELRIRSLPGVVACQLTATSVLILVGPDGDGPAVNAAVVAMLDQAASDLAVQVLAVPSPAAPIPLWRRRKAGFALAGSAAALSATVAAAATLGVITIETPRESPAISSPAEAPTTAVGTSRVRTRQTPAPSQPAPTAEPAAAFELAAALIEPAPPEPSPPFPATAPDLPVFAAAAQPVLLEIPLPPAVAAAVPPPVLAVVTAASAASAQPADDALPRGRARRVRAGIERRDDDKPAAPSANASPIATAAGSLERAFDLSEERRHHDRDNGEIDDLRNHGREA